MLLQKLTISEHFSKISRNLDCFLIFKIGKTPQFAKHVRCFLTFAIKFSYSNNENVYINIKNKLLNHNTILFLRISCKPLNIS